MRVKPRNLDRCVGTPSLQGRTALECAHGSDIQSNRMTPKLAGSGDYSEIQSVHATLCKTPLPMTARLCHELRGKCRFGVYWNP